MTGLQELQAEIRTAGQGPACPGRILSGVCKDELPAISGRREKNVVGPRTSRTLAKSWAGFSL